MSTDVQLLEILNFLEGDTRLDSFLKAYITAETKRYFPYERFNHPEELNNTQLPPYETLCSKLRNNSPLEKDYSRLQIFF